MKTGAEVNDFMVPIREIRETSPEEEEQLARAKTILRQQSEDRILIDMAGPWAGKILRETVPEPDPITETAFHEAGHFRMFQLLALPVAAIEIRRYVEGRLIGAVCPMWESIGEPLTASDGKNTARRLQLCQSVGIQLDPDALSEKARGMLRADWSRVQRIARHVASCCYAGDGNEWHLVISTETIARLFWTDDEWQERYGRGMCEE